MAAVARAIGETSGAVQLNGFFGKIFLEFIFVKLRATLPMYLFVSLLVNINCLSSYFLALKIFRGFSLNLIHESNWTPR